MIFVSVETRQEGYTHIDGYSNVKTIKGAIKDLAREVAKINQNEANVLTDYIDDTIAMLNQPHDSPDYFIECEEVPSASRIIESSRTEKIIGINQIIEDYDMEYKEANFYLHISFVA
jgi:hypothetical protein